MIDPLLAVGVSEARTEARMPWYPVDKSHSAMPCVRETSAAYSGEDCSSLGIYPYATNPDPSAGYTTDTGGSGSYPYVSAVPGGGDNYRYYQPQNYQVGTPRDTSFAWGGGNNFDCSYPGYTHRAHSDTTTTTTTTSATPTTPVHRKHPTAERHERSNRKRRAPTVAQRRAANIRERRRMYNLNEAFDSLRQRIPTFAYEKRLSRIETLRLAISYISFMTGIVNGEDPNSLHVNFYDSPSVTPTSSSRRSQSSVYPYRAGSKQDDILDFEEGSNDEDMYESENSCKFDKIHCDSGVPSHVGLRPEFVEFGSTQSQ